MQLKSKSNGTDFDSDNHSHKKYSNLFIDIGDDSNENKNDAITFKFADIAISRRKHFYFFVYRQTIRRNVNTLTRDFTLCQQQNQNGKHENRFHVELRRVIFGKR